MSHWDCHAMTDLLVRQGGDDVAQGGEGEVDVGALLQSVPSGSCTVCPLTPSQVHDVDQGSFFHFFAGLIFRLLCKLNADNGVGPGGGGVHVGAGNGPVDIPLLHPLADVVIRAHYHLLQPIS